MKSYKKFINDTRSYRDAAKFAVAGVAAHAADTGNHVLSKTGAALIAGSAVIAGAKLAKDMIGDIRKNKKKRLSEMAPVDNDYNMGHRFPLHRYDQYMRYHDERNLMKHHGTYNVNDEYDIQHHSVTHETRRGTYTKHYYNVVHKPTGHIHLHLTTTVHPYWHHKTQQVSNLAGVEGNKFKATDLYHHLLKNKIITNLFSDHTQSIGGKKTWQRLSKKKGINMRLMKRGKEVHMNKVWNKNYNDFNTTFLATYKDT